MFIDKYSCLMNQKGQTSVFCKPCSNISQDTKQNSNS
jgi:hypothetical protein